MTIIHTGAFVTPVMGYNNKGKGAMSCPLRRSNPTAQESQVRTLPTKLNPPKQQERKPTVARYITDYACNNSTYADNMLLCKMRFTVKQAAV